MKHHWGSEIINKDDKDLPGLKFSYVQKWLDNKKGKLLEIGCGSGKILRSINYYNNKLELHGCDISSEGFNNANCSKVVLLKCDGKNMIYRDCMFDYILVSDYLEHVDDVEKAINEIHRVLKTSGSFHCFVPIEGEKFSMYYIFKKIFGKDTFYKTKDHIQSFTKNQIINILCNNFKIININYSYHLLGHSMDAILFTATLNKRIAKLFWGENKFYNKNPKKTVKVKIFNMLMNMANYIAWLESYLLQNSKFGACGIHITCIKKDNKIPGCFCSKVIK